MRLNQRHVWIAIALLAIAAGVPVVAQQPCAATDYDCKITVQTKKIQTDPNNAEAYYNRAVAYIDKKNYTNAKADLDKYLAIPNTNNEYLADGYYERGWTRSQLNDFAGALADYNKALGANPNKKVVYSDRGWAKYKLKDLVGALADYDQAITAYPNSASPYFRKGMVLGDQNKWQLAIASYDTALKYDELEYEVYYNRGRAYRELGNYDKAILEYTQYIGLNSAKLEYAADGFRGRGIVYNLTGKYELAVADLTKAIQFDSGIASSYEERAKAYRKLGKVDLAIADEAKAKSLR